MFIFRTRLVEKQVFDEKEELKSKLESAMEEKFKLEKVRDLSLWLLHCLVLLMVQGKTIHVMLHDVGRKVRV